MDADIRWLRHYVLARVAERLTVEGLVAAALIGLALVATSTPSPLAALAAAVGGIVVASGRLAVAVASSPVNHRYLLDWADPSSGLTVEPVTAARSSTAAAELSTLGFRFRGRLGPGVEPRGGGGADPRPGLDLFDVERGRAVAAWSDDGELTLLSRLADGRLLVTGEGFVPPAAALVVNRLAPASADERGDPFRPTVTAHAEMLVRLRRTGLEAIRTDPATVGALLGIEWEAWQQVGPLIGPLIELGPPGRGLGLRVSIPVEIVARRTSRHPSDRSLAAVLDTRSGRRPAAPRPRPTADPPGSPPGRGPMPVQAPAVTTARTRSRPASG